MKKLLTLVASLFLLTTLCASLAVAEEIKNDVFTLNLPDEWKVMVPWNTNNKQMTAIQNTKDMSSITIVVGPMEKGKTTKDFATALTAMLEKQGLKKKDMKQVDNTYISTFSLGAGTTVAYFASNGKEASMVTIAGTKLDSAKELLKALKPADPELFPKTF